MDEPRGGAQLVAQGAGGGEPVRRVLGHRVTQDPVGGLDERPAPLHLRHGAPHVAGDDLELALAPVRRLAGERHPEHAAERVDVGGGAGAGPAVQLGRHVRRRPDHRGADAGGLGVHPPGDAEVAEVGLDGAAAAAHQHIGRLDVAVHEPGRVRVGEAAGHLRDELDGLAHRGGSPLRDHLAEVAVRDQLGGDVEEAVLLAVGVDLDDVRGVQRGQRPGLAAEPLPERGVVGEHRGDDLERHAPVERLLDRAVDDPHPAGPELGHDAEATDAVAGGGEG